MQETTFPVEILIHDDASTDGTDEIIRGYERRYPHLIKPIYQKENQYSKGYKMNPTFNFPRARGEYIALCEGDDYWVDSKKLGKQVGILNDNKNISICGHRIQKVDQYGNTLEGHACQGDHVDGLIRQTDAVGGAILHTATFFFRRRDISDAINRHGAIFGKLPAGDDPIFFLLLGYGDGYCLKDVCSVYRLQPGSTWDPLSPLEKKYKMIQFFCAIPALSVESKDRTAIIYKSRKIIATQFEQSLNIRDWKYLLKSVFHDENINKSVFVLNLISDLSYRTITKKLSQRIRAKLSRLFTSMRCVTR